MSELKTLHITSANVEKLSRHEMLQWVNKKVASNYSKIEHLCSGVAYCQLMEMVYPNSIGMKKVKMNAKFEHEYIHNLKLFQSAFAKQKFDKSVPIERMVQGRFQDNFEFLQWFKKFYDTQISDKENNCCLTQEKSPKPRTPSISIVSSNLNKKHPTDTTERLYLSKKPFASTLNLKSSGITDFEKKNITTRKSLSHIPDRPASPTSFQILNSEIDVLKKKVHAVEQQNVLIEKLNRIEKLCNSEVGYDLSLRDRVLEVLRGDDELIE